MEAERDVDDRASIRNGEVIAVQENRDLRRYTPDLVNEMIERGRECLPQHCFDHILANREAWVRGACSRKKEPLQLGSGDIVAAAGEKEESGVIGLDCLECLAELFASVVGPEDHVIQRVSSLCDLEDVEVIVVVEFAEQIAIEQIKVEVSRKVVEPRIPLCNADERLRLGFYVLSKRLRIGHLREVGFGARRQLVENEIRI